MRFTWRLTGILGALLIGACASDKAGDSAPDDTEVVGVDSDACEASDEICDGVDNDCDGAVDAEDDDLVDGETYFADADGDSYGDRDNPVVSCDLPGDGLATSPADCDDDDPAVYPGAEEIWYDGVDQDCDTQSDYDQDGDGYDSAADGDGTDCDDDPLTGGEVYPGAPEICDGVDNDCDAGTPADAGCLGPDDAYATLLGDDSADVGGSSVALLDDLDGDGAAEVVVGAPGRGSSEGGVYLLRGDGLSGERTLGSAEAALLGSLELVGVGYGLAAPGDVDGDGLGDLWFTASATGVDSRTAGACFASAAGLAGELSLEDAGLACYHGDSDADAGEYLVVAGAGDLDGDGLADLATGHPGADLRGRLSGVAHVFPATAVADGAILEEEALLVIEGDRPRVAMGSSIAGVGDVDGDGIDDLLVGSSAESSALTASLQETASPGDEAGAAFLFLGPVSGALSIDDADLHYAGSDARDHAGAAVAGVGDVDGDGVGDMLIGADNAEAGFGAAYLVSARRVQLRDEGDGGDLLRLDDAAATLVGAADRSGAGQSVAGAGDVNGDGRADLLVGAPSAPFEGEYAGAVYVVLGPVKGRYELAGADRIIQETKPGAAFGWSVAGGADVDGDGLDDVLAGAPGYGTPGVSRRGAAFLFTGL